ncbi:MAG: hypothetical protein IPH23_14935 [Gammaproteobacteria bacterium]|nr:hypothetical protein [Gammaproteobacteria bacterium]
MAALHHHPVRRRDRRYQHSPEQKTPFLEGDPLPPTAPTASVCSNAPVPECVALHEHCRRAIDYTTARRGRHGLPLIGTGDWNDALDHVGHRGPRGKRIARFSCRCCSTGSYGAPPRVTRQPPPA